MEVVAHPYLKGVQCREDGAVFIPAARAHPGHWTFGSQFPNGYLQVRVDRKHYRVHRLICEAFHGLCPEGKGEVDHINRKKDDNRPENLRWVTHQENILNRVAGDGNAYNRTYNRTRYANDPEYREMCKSRTREYLAKKKAKAAQK